MKTVTTLADYVKHNDTDTRKIVRRVYPQIENFHDLDDVIQNMYVRFEVANTVGRWDPNNTAKFSTWMYTCISNFIGAYYRKASVNEHGRRNTLSLDWNVGGSDTKGNYTSFAEILDVGDSNLDDFFINLKQIRVLLKEFDKVSANPKISSVKLLDYYLKDWTDSEIADAVGMTCAGIGASKKVLRTLVKECESGRIYSRIASSTETKRKKEEKHRKKEERREELSRKNFLNTGEVYYAAA